MESSKYLFFESISDRINAEFARLNENFMIGAQNAIGNNFIKVRFRKDNTFKKQFKVCFRKWPCFVKDLLVIIFGVKLRMFLYFSQ